MKMGRREIDGSSPPLLSERNRGRESLPPGTVRHSLERPRRTAGSDQPALALDQETRAWDVGRATRIRFVTLLVPFLYSRMSQSVRNGSALLFFELLAGGSSPLSNGL